MALLDLQTLEVQGDESMKVFSCSSVVDGTGCVSNFSVFC